MPYDHLKEKNRKHPAQADIFAVRRNQSFFVPTGNIDSFRKLFMYGLYRVEGSLSVKEKIDYKDDGKISVADSGVVNIGWSQVSR